MGFEATTYQFSGQVPVGDVTFPDGGVYNMGAASWPNGPTLGEMGIDTNGLQQIPSISSRPVAPPLSREEAGPTDLTIGAVGTPIYSGFVRDLGEYNPKLDGRTAFITYEKMRRSDGDVRAALMACKLPIRAAEKQILPGTGPNEPNHEFAKEIADFVRENLFNGLETQRPSGSWATQAFESVEENALLALDFGCAAHEDIWAIDGERVRLRRMAPRLPTTFYRFWTDSDGETLTALEQYGYRKNDYVNVRIPAEKLCLFTNEKEGANFYGRSLLRAAYMHYWIKSNLYRIDAVALERNAMGIPTFHLPTGYDPSDREKAMAWARQLITHEQTGLVLPPGWNFEVNGIKGRLRDPWNSIRHHSEEIVRSVLAMFMALGTTTSGSRSLGNAFLDFFFLSLEATARHISDTISNGTIRRLVDYNYTPKKGQRLPYPKLVYSSIVVLDPIELMNAIKDLANSQTDVFQPDDELENYLRRKTGLPLKTQMRPRFAPVMQRIMESPAVGETIAQMERSEGNAIVDPQNAAPNAIVSQGNKVRNTTVNKPKGGIPGLEPQPDTAPPSKKVQATEVTSDEDDDELAELSELRELATCGMIRQLMLSDGEGQTICVDFDNTLATTTHDMEKVGEPIGAGLQLVKELNRKGYRIVIFTARTNRTPVKDFLRANGVSFSRITNVKPPEAVAFIDDKALSINPDKPATYAKALKRIEKLEKRHKKARL